MSPAPVSRHLAWCSASSLLTSLSRQVFQGNAAHEVWYSNFFFSVKDRDHCPHLYLAQPMFSLRLSVSARALSWRFLFLFVEVQARDNSEKQEASAVLFPSWSPATKGKKKTKPKPTKTTKPRAVPLFRTSRNGQSECRATACIKHTLSVSPRSKRPPHCLCHWVSTAPTYWNQGFAASAASISRGKHLTAWHRAVLLPDASASSSRKINVFS